MSSLTFASHPLPATVPTANPAPSQEQQQEPEEPIVVLERRFVYGRGFVEVGASFEESVLLLEERVGGQTHIIPITTADGQQRLLALLKLFRSA
jgi:hypothetical protein